MILLSREPRSMRVGSGRVRKSLWRAWSAVSCFILGNETQIARHVKRALREQRRPPVPYLSVFCLGVLDRPTGVHYIALFGSTRRRSALRKENQTRQAKEVNDGESGRRPSRSLA